MAWLSTYPCGAPGKAGGGLCASPWLLSQARLVGPAKRGRAPSESSALTSMRAEIGARPKGRICAPIDKVEPTVDTAGPQVAPALKEEAR